MSEIRKYEDRYKRVWYFEIGKLEFRIELKKRSFKPIEFLKKRRCFHIKF